MNTLALPGLHWHPSGYATLSGPLRDLAEALDQRFLACAGRDLTHYSVPTFIAVADLEPTAWLRSFPHLATFAASASRAPGMLDALARAQQAGRLPAQTALEPVEQVLTPAACHHLYPGLRDRDLAQDAYLTLRAHCHRREAAYAPLARQWCFQMRELVCIGSRAAVEAFVADCCARIDALVRSLDLEARWLVATDPFFDAQADPKALAQRLEPVKTELTLADGLAVASINRHRSFFGERYRIARAGAPAHSACVAFGIERWLLAVATARGADPAAWRIQARAAA